MLVTNKIVHPKMLHTFKKMDAINPTYEAKPIKTDRKITKDKAKYKPTIKNCTKLFENTEKTAKKLCAILIVYFLSLIFRYLSVFIG
jgi:hypothetical protein